MSQSTDTTSCAYVASRALSPCATSLPPFQFCNRPHRTVSNGCMRSNSTRRIQLHKHGDSAAAFTKNGHDHSSRVRRSLARLKGVRSLVIDGELVACDGDGLPVFYALYAVGARERGIR